MIEAKEFSNSPEMMQREMPALPTGLNILTILTFIGSGIALVTSIWSFINAEKGYKDLQDAQTKLTEAPAWAKGMMGPEMLEVSRKSMENKLPLLLLGIVAALLCIYGAIEMRKLKKQGFILWLAGELLPIVAGLLFIGTGLFTGVALIGSLFPVVFIILYLVQRKYLVY